MKSKYCILIAAAGGVGAVLRALSLLHGYEPSGLPVPGYLPAMLLIGLTAIVCIAAVVLSAAWFRDETEFEELFHAASIRSTIGMLCGVVIAVCGLFALLSINDLILEQSRDYVEINMGIWAATMALWALCLIFGIMMIFFCLWQKKNIPAKKTTGWLLTIPLFWCCVDLVMLYHDNSGEPVVSSFAYQILLTVAVMASLYTMAAFLFAKPSTIRFYAASGIAVYLTAVQCLGTLIAKLFSGTPIFAIPGTYDLTVISLSGTFRMWLYLAVGIFLLLQISGTNNKKA